MDNRNGPFTKPLREADRFAEDTSMHEARQKTNGSLPDAPDDGGPKAVSSTPARTSR